MPDYLALPEQDQREILQAAATKLGRQAWILEKDVWLCWTLKTLFAMPGAHPMAFKGGTSLSKGYGAINRFSEDVDVTLDYRFADDYDPFAEGASGNQTKKYSDRLKGYVQVYAHETLVPYLQNELNKLPRAEKYQVEADETGEKIWIPYPTVTEPADEYLKPQVLIELGGRNVIDPNRRVVVSPYIDGLATGVTYPTGEVMVLTAERTFWEKATLAHVECHRGRLTSNAERLSRHWYDLFQLASHESGQTAINDSALLEDVIRCKKVFFNSNRANYDACLEGALRLVPDTDSLEALGRDYRAMTAAGMFYKEPPKFDELVEKLHQLERDINTW